MTRRKFAVAAGAVLAVGALTLGLREGFSASTTPAASSVPATPTSAPAVALGRHHRHHRFAGFAGSFQVWRSSTHTVVSWGWVRGTLDALSSSSITVTEPNGQVVTAPLSSIVRFRGTSETQAASELGAHVLVVERNGQVARVVVPRHRLT